MIYKINAGIEYTIDAIVVLKINKSAKPSPVVSVNASFFITIVFIVLLNCLL